MCCYCISDYNVLKTTVMTSFFRSCPIVLNNVELLWQGIYIVLTARRTLNEILNINIVQNITILYAQEEYALFVEINLILHRGNAKHIYIRLQLIYSIEWPRGQSSHFMCAWTQVEIPPWSMLRSSSEPNLPKNCRFRPHKNSSTRLGR